MIIKLGKCVNTHGIKGEIRISTKFKNKDKVFIKGFNLYFGENKIKEVINTYRHHKEYEMVTLNGINNINDVLKYKGIDVYINTDDIIKNNDTIINEELIGYDTYFNEKNIGKVTDIMYNNGNDLFVIEGIKEILVPINKNFIERIDHDNKIIYFINIEGLM